MVLGLRPGSGYVTRGGDVAWTYSPEDLATFGIREIYIDGDEWAPALEVDGQSVCLLNVASGRCATVPRRR
jgi:hypothetical protein